MISRKQKRFIEEYCKCLNSAEAARRAGYKEKYAHKIGSKLLKRVDINGYVNDILDADYKDREAFLRKVKSLADSESGANRMRAYELIARIRGFINDAPVNQTNIVSSIKDSIHNRLSNKDLHTKPT